MVPGGTGLLAELAVSKGKKLKEALTLAHDRLRRCACNKREPAVQACYQCLFAYRDQNDLHQLERDTACSLLETMLEGFEGLTKVENGLDGVPLDSLLESELERRLYGRLVRLGDEDSDFVVTPLENESLVLTVAGRKWRVTPQRYIDAANTAVPCRPDFLIEPVGQGSDILAVAVFADGLEYHVKPNDVAGRIADDITKRGELIRTGRYRVWSLSWWDVDGSESTLGVDPWLPGGEVINTAARLTPKLKCPSVGLATANAFNSLVAYLKEPNSWAKSAACVAFALLHTSGRQLSSARSDELLTLLSTSSEPTAATAFKELLAGQSEVGGEAVGAVLSFGEDAGGWLLVVVQKSELGALANRPESARAVLRLRDRSASRRTEGFRNTWLAWMRAQNFLQFLPGLELTSDERIEPPVVEQVGEVASIVVNYKATKHFEPVLKAAELPRGTKPKPELDRILLELDESIHPLMRAAAAQGFTGFSAPYEIEGQNGIEGDIEVAWSALRIGLYFDHQRDMAKRLESDGWRLLPIEARPSPAQLLSLLEEA